MWIFPAKAATAAAALLPTAVAAMSSVRISTKIQQDQQSEHFHKVIDLLLNDMKTFKRLVRKSLNLLQGMEMISGGSYLTVDPSTGASSAFRNSTAAASNSHQPAAAAVVTGDESNNGPGGGGETKLVKGLGGRTTFPALRQAAYKCTVQIIEAYREAVSKLMEVSPLADHVDLREHYIAFVSLENFGIHPDRCQLEMTSNNPITVQELKETAQIALVQQSEYLRRFSLTFCEKVREDNDINKAGVLKHIRDLFTTIRQINNRLSRVLEYHQAMGLNIEDLEEKEEQKNKQKSVTTTNSKALSKKQPTLRSYNPHKFVPLRSIYTSMFSTGLHLQHSLLKLRKLEQLFETLDKRNRRQRNASGTSGGSSGRASPQIPIEETQLVEWLRGFQEIQAELNACVGCLDEGVSQIDTLQGTKKDENLNDDNDESSPTTTSSDFQSLGATAAYVDGNEFEEHADLYDEVFEAFIDGREAGVDYLNRLDEDAKQTNELAQQSNQVLRELKRVLVYKAREHEIREAQALSRQRGETITETCNLIDPFGLPIGQARANFPWVNSNFDDSFTDPAAVGNTNHNHHHGINGINSSNGTSSDDFEDEDTSSSSSCPTVRSVSPKDPCDNDDIIIASSKDDDDIIASLPINIIPRSISGQLLESEDEEEVDNDEDEDDDILDDNQSSMTESCSHFGTTTWENSELDIPTTLTSASHQDFNALSLAESRTTCCSMVSLDTAEDFLCAAAAATDKLLPSSLQSLSANVRSISSPDLKNLEANARSYRHLRPMITNGKAIDDHSADGGDHDDDGDITDDGSDDARSVDGDGWGSADELEVNVLKTFQRPLRPAASAVTRRKEAVSIARPAEASESPYHLSSPNKLPKKRTLRQKRDRNKSNISDISDIAPPITASTASSTSTDITSSYYSKRHESEDNPLSKPLQHLTGFHSSMALEAARAALAFKNGTGAADEEIIIGASSESDDDD